MKFIWQAVKGDVLLASAILLLVAAGSMLLLSPGEKYYPGSVFDNSFTGHSGLLSELSSTRSVRVLASPSVLRAGEILVIPAPIQEVPPEFVEFHLASGGTVLISDASENTDALLSSLGIARSGGPIVDKESHHVREDAPLYQFAGGFFAAKHSYAVSCSPGENCSALLRSSKLSWTDDDQSGYLDESDRAGPFAAAIAMAKGSARANVIVVGDRSAFTNDLLNLSQAKNREFLSSAILSLDPGGHSGVVVYDAGKSEQGAAMSYALAAAELLRSPFTLALLALAAAAALFFAREKQQQAPQTRFATLANGVESNLGKRREAYVWTATRLRALLLMELDGLSKAHGKAKPGVQPENFIRAKRHLGILNSTDFEKMDAVSLERTIEETARIISSIRQDGYSA